jgi:hypothetical protein
MEDMDPSSYDELIRHLRRLGPFNDDAAAERTLAAVLGVLGRRLLPEERTILLRRLPRQCTPMLAQSGVGAEPALLHLVHELAQRQNVSVGNAAEHLEIVVRAIDEMAGEEARVQLVRAVPELAGAFEPRAPAPDLPAEPPAGGPSDLAEGIAGARHSLSSADPARLAHRHSVARADDPHGDSKLSSARGLMQERDDDSLASGRPGSRRPLSSGH